MSPRNHRSLFVALLAAMALVVAACGGGSDSDSASSDSGGGSSDLSGSINVSGSSTVEPVSTRVAELFNDNVAPDVEITVDGPGTGDGFRLFCAGETDVSDASRTIKGAEIALCEEAGVEYVELKVAFDGIAVMTSTANSAVECLSFADLYALLGPEAEGTDTWGANSAVGTELGSTVAPYPDAELFISAPGTESGTYDSFIEIVLEGMAEERLGEVETFVRTDFAGQADDNVIVQGIAGNDTSLGWVGFAFADENQDSVKTLQVTEEPGGACTSPTIGTIADGTYPVSRSLYIYVNKARAASNPSLVAYIDYYLGDGYNESVSKAFGESGYVPLPDDLLAETQAAWTGR